MGTNKKPDDASGGSEESELVRRIDAMMDPAKKDADPAAATPPAANEPLDIFAGTNAPEIIKTAPELPGKHRKVVEPVRKQEPIPEQPKTPDPKPADKPAVVPQDPSPAPAASEPAAPEATDIPVPETSIIDDADTDKVVDDIVAKEGDELLAAKDALAEASSAPKTETTKPATGNRLKRLLKKRRLWAALIVIILLTAVVPPARYKVLGLVIHRPVSITVLDSTTHTPVSSATVELQGATARTAANGTAVLRAKPGQGNLVITKKYYRTSKVSYFVGLSGNKAVRSNLVATGRQVPVTILNTITGKPVTNAEIKVLDTSAKTDTHGKAVIVLPAKADADGAAIRLKGYNDLHANIKVTADVVPENTLHLTPAGHLYFLSDLNGTIDVVKTYLDGTGRQTVLAGTGKEDPRTTSLLASRDWRYLVLKARRESSQSGLYLIDTKNDKVNQFDYNNATYELIGWSGHRFMYHVTNDSLKPWQAAKETIKSYDAELGEPSQLDASQAEGDSSHYAYQGFYNFFVAGDLLVYNTQWYGYDAYGSTYDLGSKVATIRAVQPGGQNKKDYQSFPASGLGYISAARTTPAEVIYSVYNGSDNKTLYYAYSDRKVSQPSDLDGSAFNKTYPAYLLSPSGSQTFWAEVRDGKNALFMGNDTADKKSQVASLSPYAAYGWYGDDYLLLSKAGSELYIVARDGLKDGAAPYKITDYFKPVQTYDGYGYGGL